MGSTGTGRLTDYPGGRGGKKGAGEGGSEGEHEPNQCDRDLDQVQLEEIERCGYFHANGTVPPVGEAVSIRNSLLKGRIAVETEEGVDIGVLPTEFNYIVGCMNRGYTYRGQVVSSQNDSSLQRITVDLSSFK